MKRLNFLFWNKWSSSKKVEVEDLKTQIPQIIINDEDKKFSTIASPNPLYREDEQIWEIQAKKIDFFPKDEWCMTTDELEEKWPHLKENQCTVM